MIQMCHCKNWKNAIKSMPSLEERSVVEIRKEKTNLGNIKHIET